MPNLRETLLTVADAYETEVRQEGGRSLARITTVVLNRGSFFDHLRSGKTCTLESYEKIVDYFCDQRNWPLSRLPPVAVVALEGIGRDLAAEAE